MKYRLVHLTGSLAGRVRELDAAVVVLGRDPDEAQVVFSPEDRLVGRRHAELREEDGALVLRDLDSRAGTFLDGQDIEEAELADGDVFELGPGGPRLRVEFAVGGTLVVGAQGLPSAAGSATLAPRHAAAAPPPGSKLRLTFLSGTRRDSFLELAGSVIRIGRAPGSAVWTPDDRVVSAQHAKIVRLDEGYVLMDLESTNGTFVNGHRVERALIQTGDVVTLGTEGPEVRVQVLTPDLADRTSQATVVIPNFAELAVRASSASFVREVPLDRPALTLGRGSEADVYLDSPIVSKLHARLVRDGELWVVQDLASANGTFVRGQRVVDRAALAPGDRAVVGPFELELAPPVARLFDTRSRARLDARGLTVLAAGRPILDDVSLSLPPGSFTAVIGPSGSGKSTLLSAMNGSRPAHRGQVLLNGADLYRSFESLKASLGYVPQDDIVHRELTVAESLEYTARLRLPPDTTPAERAKRLADVLATLELTERRDLPIHRLSGGQRKRVSIATELLTEPNVLFLDEPTSGLDPGLEEALMLLLRELAYKGKTVVLVTHTLDNIQLCDAVVLLVDGRLAFCGSALEARGYFDIEHMVNLYARLKERPATEWQLQFRASDGYRQHVESPLSDGSAAAAPAPDRPEAARPRASALRQLGVLTARYFRALTRDRRNAGLLVAQAPLIAGLIGLSLLYGPAEVAYSKPKNTLLLMLSLTSVWFGCSNSVREIVKERAIYLRERMVNLRVLPYVLSKLLILGGLAAVQCVLLLGILHSWFGIPGRLELLLGSMLLASVAGILLGLALSALSTTADRAMTLLPIALIPQLLFTFPAVQMDMKGPAGLVARGMPTWWAFDLLRRVAIAPDQAKTHDEIEERLKQNLPVLMTKARFEEMLGEGYMMFNYRTSIEATWTASFAESLGERLPSRLGRWRAAVADALALGLFAAVLCVATVLLQRRHDRRPGG